MFESSNLTQLLCINIGHRTGSVSTVAMSEVLFVRLRKQVRHWVKKQKNSGHRSSFRLAFLLSSFCHKQQSITH